MLQAFLGLLDPVICPDCPVVVSSLSDPSPTCGAGPEVVVAQPPGKSEVRELEFVLPASCVLLDYFLVGR